MTILERISQKKKDLAQRSVDLYDEISQTQGFLFGLGGFKKRELNGKRKVIDKCNLSIKDELILGGYSAVNINVNDLEFEYDHLCYVYLKYNFFRNGYDVYLADSDIKVCSLDENFTQHYGACRSLYGCIVKNDFVYANKHVPRLYLTVLLDQTTESFLDTID